MMRLQNSRWWKRQRKITFFYVYFVLLLLLKFEHVQKVLFIIQSHLSSQVNLTGFSFFKFNNRHGTSDPSWSRIPFLILPSISFVRSKIYFWLAFSLRMVPFIAYLLQSIKISCGISSRWKNILWQASFALIICLAVCDYIWWYFFSTKRILRKLKVPS